MLPVAGRYRTALAKIAPVLIAAVTAAVDPALAHGVPSAQALVGAVFCANITAWTIANSDVVGTRFIASLIYRFSISGWLTQGSIDHKKRY
ncbi:MAG TPA: hypothetical protein VGP04_04760 [Pseudonocardiaceae bacterium]|nr:hypothetical protein [Pseudonocardiaceae bacterium]